MCALWLQIFKGAAYDPFDMHVWLLHGAAVHAYDKFFGCAALFLLTHRSHAYAMLRSLRAASIACLCIASCTDDCMRCQAGHIGCQAEHTGCPHDHLVRAMTRYQQLTKVAPAGRMGWGRAPSMSASLVVLNLQSLERASKAVRWTSTGRLWGTLRTMTSGPPTVPTSAM